MLPSMLAQWQVGSLQKFIPAVYCSYYERFKTWYDRSPRIVGIPSVFIICTPTSAPSNIAFNGMHNKEVPARLNNVSKHGITAPHG